MANISIYDLRPAGADLFDDSENYLQELTDVEFSETNGGGSWASTLACIIAHYVIAEDQRLAERDRIREERCRN